MVPNWGPVLKFEVRSGFGAPGNIQQFWRTLSCCLLIGIRTYVLLTSVLSYCGSSSLIREREREYDPLQPRPKSRAFLARWTDHLVSCLSRTFSQDLLETGGAQMLVSSAVSYNRTTVRPQPICWSITYIFSPPPWQCSNRLRQGLWRATTISQQQLGLTRHETNLHIGGACKFLALPTPPPHTSRNRAPKNYDKALGQM